MSAATLTQIGLIDVATTESPNIGEDPNADVTVQRPSYDPLYA
jgi:hypothetical protein